jgi:sugar lactone lactonase YvrE
MIPDRTWIGGMALNHDGRIVVAGHENLMIFDPQTGIREILFDKVGETPVLAINDVQPDGHGGIYCGLIDPNGMVSGQHRPQPLVLLGADRTVRTVAEGIKIPNGIGLSPDRGTLYLVETMEGVLAYDRSPDGSLANRRLMVAQGSSDGMAVDSEGYIWIACVQGGSLSRCTPEGALDRRIEFPVTQVASLVFGGEDLRDLYAVTGSAIGAGEYERTSRVYRLRTEVPGQATPLTGF